MRSLGRVAVGACVAGGLTAAATAAQAYVKSSITVDARTGAVLQSRNADASHAPASLNKMMTLYLVFEALSRRRLYWNSRVTISRHASTRSPVKLYLRVGARVRVRDLVYATAVKSANDAATALAEKIAGSEGRFARLMTIRGRQLGMRRTVFRTASGLPAFGQRTTARDMAVLARALIRHYPQYYRVFATRYYRFGRRAFRNTNRLLHSHPAVDGMKTGYTRRARYNLVTSARNGRVRLITVVLGASSSNVRYRTTGYLLAGAWRKARSVMYARKRNYRRVQVASRGRVGGGLVRQRTAPRQTIASARKRTVVSRRVVVAQRAKSKPTSALTKRRSSKRKIRLTLASSATAATKPGASGRYVWVKKRVVRYVRKRVVRTQQSHGIQVGAYYTRWRARYAIQRAVKRLSWKYRRKARKTIDRRRARGRTVYIARLMGYRSREARWACSSLRRRGVGCAAVSGRMTVVRYVRKRTVVTVRVRQAIPVAKKKPIIIAKATKTKPATAAKKNSDGARKETDFAAARTQADTPRRKTREEQDRTAANRLVARIKAAARSAERGLGHRRKADVSSKTAVASKSTKRKPSASGPKIAWKSVSREKWASGGAKKPRHARTATRDRASDRSKRRQIASSAREKPAYAIQVGAFSEYKWAKRGLNRAQKALPSKYARGKGTRIFSRRNDSNKAVYRARITGMSRDEAREACSILKKRSLRCLAVRTLASG